MEVSGGPGQNPARWWPAGGDGGVEEHEGSEGYPGVCSVGVGNGRRWGRSVSSSSAAVRAALRRARASGIDGVGVRSFRGPRASGFGGCWGSAWA